MTNEMIENENTTFNFGLLNIMIKSIFEECKTDDLDLEELKMKIEIVNEHFGVMQQKTNMDISYIKMVVEAWLSELYTKSILPDNLSNDESKHVYIMKFDNNDIKIGISKNIERRKKQLTNQHGHIITDCYYTDKMENASQIEAKLHDTFRAYRQEGEYFTCDYNKAIIELKKLIK